MRAKEFLKESDSKSVTINVPITITINGDEDPVISTPADNASDAALQQNPVMVAPQQQSLELQKAELGKSSPVIDKLLQSDDIGQEPEIEKDRIQDLLKNLLNR